jgi:DNA-binding NtrC family response regulator
MESAEDTLDEIDFKAPANLQGDETVIVVEDNEAVRKMVVSILERQGYKVISANSGKSCLEKIANYNGKAHLLLTDVVMPDMNGRELYFEIKSLNPEIRVIYASGYTDNVIAHHGVLDEGINFIQKPFSVQGLAVKVREVLDRK